MEGSALKFLGVSRRDRDELNEAPVTIEHEKATGFEIT